MQCTAGAANKMPRPRAARATASLTLPLDVGGRDHEELRHDDRPRRRGAGGAALLLPWLRAQRKEGREGAQRRWRWRRR